MKMLQEDMFELARQQQTANQSRFFARLQELLPQGLAFVIHLPNHEVKWTAAAPWSRLEPGLFVLEDLAEGGKRYELKFHEVSIRLSVESNDWGSLTTGTGWDVASFRPLVDSEDEQLVRAWNEHSGRAPLPMPVL